MMSVCDGRRCGGPCWHQESILPVSLIELHSALFDGLPRPQPRGLNLASYVSNLKADRDCTRACLQSVPVHSTHPMHGRRDRWQRSPRGPGLRSSATPDPRDADSRPPGLQARGRVPKRLPCLGQPRCALALRNLPCHHNCRYSSRCPNGPCLVPKYELVSRFDILDPGTKPLVQSSRAI